MAEPVHAIANATPSSEATLAIVSPSRGRWLLARRYTLNAEIGLTRDKPCCRAPQLAFGVNVFRPIG
jgi:hypothetical protein